MANTRAKELGDGISALAQEWAGQSGGSLVDSDWISIEEWSRCAEMERPGIVFELRNAEGRQLLSRCSPELPATPFDWNSPPIKFRPIEEPPAERSDPLPPAKHRP